MIQPGMLAVVEQYPGGLDWSFDVHDRLSGGRYVLTVAAWPLSDRIGRRPVMLAGVVWLSPAWRRYWRKTSNGYSCVFARD